MGVRVGAREQGGNCRGAYCALSPWRWLRNGVLATPRSSQGSVSAFLSMSVFGGVASGSSCEQPCWYAYQKCVGLGNDQNQCFEVYLDCLDTRCNGTL